VDPAVAAARRSKGNIKMKKGKGVGVYSGALRNAHGFLDPQTFEHLFPHISMHD
jgi:hypothetical protein